MRMSRRRFLGASMATTIAPVLTGFAQDTGGERRQGLSLVPAQPSGAPHYWCTWATQNYMYGHGLHELDATILQGDAGGDLARNAMTEENVFAGAGWAESFYPKIRSDLFFLLDDGWETGGTATFELDATKFPSFSGTAPERLSKLNSAVQKAGWRGAALWCRNTPEGDRVRSLETLSTSAEVRYWKIDIGDPSFDLIRLRNQAHIPLTLEHVHGELPVNGDWHKDGRFGSQSWDSRRMTILRNTDVYRTYDVTSMLSLPTTLDRLAAMLKGAEGHPELKSVLNRPRSASTRLSGRSAGSVSLHRFRPGWERYRLTRKFLSTAGVLNQRRPGRRNLWERPCARERLPGSPETWHSRW